MTYEKLEQLKKQAERVNDTLAVSRETVLELIELARLHDVSLSFPSYDPEFGDDKLCVCGHVYYRHFDSYENMNPVGCKYCPCGVFELIDERRDYRVSYYYSAQGTPEQFYSHIVKAKNEMEAIQYFHDVYMVDSCSDRTWRELDEGTRNWILTGITIREVN